MSAEMKYTKEHEWVRVEGDTGTIGITDYAQEQLGDIVFVELPEVGKTAKKGMEIAVVESVKAASEIYAPISGDVTEINEALTDAPETVNAAPTGDGWFLKIKIHNDTELGDLMDQKAYDAYVADLS